MCSSDLWNPGAGCGCGKGKGFKGEDQWQRWNLNQVRQHRGERGADSALWNQGTDSGPRWKGSGKGQWGSVAGPGAFCDSPPSFYSKGSMDSGFRRKGSDSGPREKGSSKGKRLHEGSGWNAGSEGAMSEAGSWSQGAGFALESDRWCPHCKGYGHNRDSCWSLQFLRGKGEHPHLRALEWSRGCGSRGRAVEACEEREEPREIGRAHV